MKKCGHKDGGGEVLFLVLGAGGWVGWVFGLFLVGNNDDGGYGMEKEAKKKMKLSAYGNETQIFYVCMPEAYNIYIYFYFHFFFCVLGTREIFEWHLGFGTKLKLNGIFGQICGFSFK